MKKQQNRGLLPRLKQHSRQLTLGVISLLLVAGSGAAAVRAVSCSTISDCSNKIADLHQKNSVAQNKLDDLMATASSFQDAINKLQQQINTVQASINTNEAKQAKLEAKIKQYQAEIVHQKAVLSDVIRKMYVDGGMSSIEMLATSQNLSDYVNKQEYSNVIQQKIQSTLEQINKLKTEVKAKKARVDDILKDLSTQRADLASAKAKQASMLAYNESQQDNYNSEIKSNQSKISSLKARQAQLNIELSSGGGRVIAGDPGHGGYPAKWDYPVAQDSLIDNWGMYNRECVSYTAWKVYQNYGFMPYWGGRGNANEWPGDARSAGIATGHTPKARSVAIWNVGYYGHAMWVEAVNSDGSIWVSQYNYSFNGRYSEMLVEPSMARNLTYIYFH